MTVSVFKIQGFVPPLKRYFSVYRDTAGSRDIIWDGPDDNLWVVTIIICNDDGNIIWELR